MLNVIKKFYNAFLYSWSGLKFAYKTQWAFRVELLILVISMPCAYFISTTAAEFIIMMTSIMLLPILELINSAIETTINRISFEYHELSGLAKDLASAALFVAGLQVLFVWGTFIILKFLN